MKRISSFGGVQIFNVLISIIRGKLVAILLGPEGIGLSTLLSSSTSTVQQFGSLGLNLALVKEVSSNKDDNEKLPHIVSIAIRLIILTSLFGGLLCFILSPLLSLWSFGTTDYISSYLWLGISVALSIAGAGYLSILQGMSEVKRLSKATLVGGLTGLFLCVPLYYFLGNKGIVPSLIILSLSVFLFYFISFNKCYRLNKTSFSWSIHRKIVKKLISLGLILMIGSLVGSLTSYTINAFIRFNGSIDDVGLFQAANSLTNQYVGIIFSSLALDYFPRLAAAGSDNAKSNLVINRQLEIVLLIIIPLVLLLILSTPSLIKIFLTDKFLVITKLMRWLGFGVIIQAISFPLSYIFIAKEKKRTYIWIEVVLTNVLWLTCSILFYFFFGLIGLGISLVVRSSIDVIVVFSICKNTLSYSITPETLRILIYSLTIGILGFVISFIDNLYSNLLLILLLLLSSFISLFLLRKRLKGN